MDFEAEIKRLSLRVNALEKDNDKLKGIVNILDKKIAMMSKLQNTNHNGNKQKIDQLRQRVNQINQQ